MVIDILAGLFLAASPWFFGFADAIWWPHVLVGVAVVLLAALTRRTTSIDDERDIAVAGTRTAGDGAPRTRTRPTV